MGEISNGSLEALVATPGQLQAEVARIFQIPLNAVSYPWRVLREAGEVSSGGRGRSAARVTASDAAKLLIAVAAEMPACDVLSTVRAYCALPLQRQLASDSRLPAEREAAGHAPLPNVAALQAATKGNTFLAGLTALIESGASGEIERLVADDAASGQLASIARSNHRFEVRVFGPFPQAQIRSGVGKGGLELTYTTMPEDWDELQAWIKGQPATPASDLHRDTFFRLTTIMAVAKVLKGDA